METTVSGLFTDAATAERAERELAKNGFDPHQIRVLTQRTENLHELLGEETSDAVRGALLGGAVGAVGAAIAGAALTLPPLSVFEAHWLVAAIVGALIGGVVAALIGLLIGSATGHQVQEEYEHLIARGGRVIAVHTDAAHAARAFEELAQSGGTQLSTAVHGAHGRTRQRTA